MSKIRHFILVFVAAMTIAPMLGVLADTRKDVDLVDGWDGGFYDQDVDEAPIAGNKDWAAYYAKYARIKNGPERRLADDVLWRLAIDQRTGIAMPRIVSMPDNSRRNLANKMLETVQGAAMAFADRQQRGFFARLRCPEPGEHPWTTAQEITDCRQHFKNVRELMPRRIIEQTAVTLTYASSRFLSLVDLEYTYRDEGNYVPRVVRGIAVDLERLQIFTMEACPSEGGKRPEGPKLLFRFAGLLEICDQASFERFLALVEAANVLTAPADRLKIMPKECEGFSIDEDQAFVVYLAVNGLAVHLTEFWPNAARRSCPLKLSARNPLIIPYHALGPLMKPGPLRDELLERSPTP